jgi:hypothetical protein
MGSFLSSVIKLFDCSVNCIQNTGAISGCVIFSNSSKNLGCLSCACFEDTSINSGCVVDASFSEDACNIGYVSGGLFLNTVNKGFINDDALFLGDSINSGVVNDTASFRDLSKNYGHVSGRIILCNAAVNLGTVSQKENNFSDCTNVASIETDDIGTLYKLKTWGPPNFVFAPWGIVGNNWSRCYNMITSELSEMLSCTGFLYKGVQFQVDENGTVTSPSEMEPCVFPYMVSGITGGQPITWNSLSGRYYSSNSGFGNFSKDYVIYFTGNPLCAFGEGSHAGVDYSHETGMCFLDWVSQDECGCQTVAPPPVSLGQRFYKTPCTGSDNFIPSGTVLVVAGKKQGIKQIVNSFYFGETGDNCYSVCFCRYNTYGPIGYVVIGESGLVVDVEKIQTWDIEDYTQNNQNYYYDYESTCGVSPMGFFSGSNLPQETPSSQIIKNNCLLPHFPTPPIQACMEASYPELCCCEGPFGCGYYWRSSQPAKYAWIQTLDCWQWPVSVSGSGNNGMSGEFIVWEPFILSRNPELLSFTGVSEFSNPTPNFCETFTGAIPSGNDFNINPIWQTGIEGTGLVFYTGENGVLYSDESGCLLVNNFAFCSGNSRYFYHTWIDNSIRYQGIVPMDGLTGIEVLSVNGQASTSGDLYFDLSVVCCDGCGNPVYGNFSGIEGSVAYKTPAQNLVPIYSYYQTSEGVCYAVGRDYRSRSFNEITGQCFVGECCSSLFLTGSGVFHDPQYGLTGFAFDSKFGFCPQNFEFECWFQVTDFGGIGSVSGCEVFADKYFEFDADSNIRFILQTQGENTAIHYTLAPENCIQGTNSIKTSGSVRAVPSLVLLASSVSECGLNAVQNSSTGFTCLFYDPIPICTSLNAGASYRFGYDRALTSLVNNSGFCCLVLACCERYYGSTPIDALGQNGNGSYCSVDMLTSYGPKAYSGTECGVFSEGTLIKMETYAGLDACYPEPGGNGSVYLCRLAWNAVVYRPNLTGLAYLNESLTLLANGLVTCTFRTYDNYVCSWMCFCNGVLCFY